MLYKLGSLTVLSLSFLLQAVQAQPPPGRLPRPPWAPEDRMHRVEQFKKIRLMEVLKLDEDESVRFFNRYNKFEEDIRGLERERNKIIDDVDSLVKQGREDQAYQKDFDEFIALGQKVAETRTHFYEEIRGILTPQKVAKLIVFERDFGRELREIIQDVQRERRRGPGSR